MRYEAKFTPTVEDVMTGYRMFKRQPDDFLKLCAFGGITALVIFGIAAYVLHFLMLAVTGILTCSSVIGVPWLSEWNARRHLKKSKPEELKFYFTEDGVEFSSSSQQWKYRWDELTKSLVDKRGVLLNVSSESFYTFVPAGAFVGGYFPLPELKSLLSSKK
jgi:YcxB-like protein